MITPVTITLADGKKRVLSYPLSSCRRIDEVSGRERSVMLGAIWDEDFSIEAFALLVWGGLIHAEPDLTVERVQELIHAHQVREIQDAIIRAWKGLAPSTTEDGEEVPPNAPAMKRSRGRKSGR